MDPIRITQAAQMLVAARQQHTRIAPFPSICQPRTQQEAHAIQDAVTALLGATVCAFKASAAPTSPPPAPPTPDADQTTRTDASAMIAPGQRAPIYAATTARSPARIPASWVPQCGVEGEVAFRFRHDLPPRPTPYTRAEITAAVDACAAIELVTSRFADPAATTALDRLADCTNNGGFVYAEAITDWQHLDFATLMVTLTVNGQIVLRQQGGHPTGDPLTNVVALVEMMRSTIGVTAGQWVTCGSYTGLLYLQPGDICHVSFDGLGSADVTFTP